MQDRKKELLISIISEFIKTAIPIGSKLLAGDFDLSPATIRNEMAELEEEGFIFQPHTSAGRLPTEKGYKFFIENIKEEGKLNKKLEDILRKYKNIKSRNDLKTLAKEISQSINEAIIVAFEKNDIYYTGISYLFSKPEFKDYNLVMNISRVVDHLDERIHNNFKEIHSFYLKVGKENPFGSDCAVIMAKGKKCVFGIIGPIRMDYKNNIVLIKNIKDLI